MQLTCNHFGLGVWVRASYPGVYSEDRLTLQLLREIAIR